MFKGVFIALLALAVPCAAAVPVDDRDGATPPRPTTRVRPHDGRAATLLLNGLSRSATLRNLVEELERLHVIVYIEMQPNVQRQLAGRLTWVTAVQTFRYVRISINPELPGDAAIAVLGHELRHALEVAHAPSIVSEGSLEAYYRKHGINMRSHRSGWDTQAARDAGDVVRREIAASPAQRGAESIEAFDPTDWHTVYRRALERFPTATR